jgi:hypothetical protein
MPIILATWGWGGESWFEDTPGIKKYSRDPILTNIQAWWYIPVMAAAQKAEIGQITDPSQKVLGMHIFS